MKSIYAITPSGIDFKKLINEIEKMLSLGIKLFQYREKSLSEEQLKNNASILLEVIKKNNGKLFTSSKRINALRQAEEENYNFAILLAGIG